MKKDLKNKIKKMFKYKKYKSYLLGFFISLILTIIPFILVKEKNLFKNKFILLFVVSICTVTQITVHLFYFLHINISKNELYKKISLIFTSLVAAIIITGSLWIMWHLHHNLMSH